MQKKLSKKRNEHLVDFLLKMRELKISILSCSNPGVSLDKYNIALLVSNF